MDNAFKSERYGDATDFYIYTNEDKIRRHGFDFDIETVSDKIIGNENY